MSLSKIHIEPLSGPENYVDWSIRLKDLLIKDDLIEPIEADFTKASLSSDVTPHSTDTAPLSSDIADSTKLTKNRKTLSIIRLLCAKNTLLYIRDETSAYLAWKKLEEIYYPKGFTTEYLTLKELFDTKMVDFDDMGQYLNKVKILVDDLRAKDINLPNQVVIAWVLNSLDDSYQPFVQNITQSLRKDPAAYTADSLFASLIDEARGHQPSQQQADQLLYSSQSQRQGQGQRQRQGRQLPKNQFKNLPYQDAFCRNCKKNGHYIGDCWWLHEDKRPAGWTQNNRVDKNATKPVTRASALKKPPSAAKRDAMRQEKLIAAIMQQADESAASGSQDGSEEEINLNSLDIDQDEDLDLIDWDSEVRYQDNQQDSQQDTHQDIYADNTLSTDCLEMRRKKKIEPKAKKDLDVSNVEFIIDTGATVCAVNNVKYFNNYYNTNKTVVWGKAKKLHIRYAGDLIFRSNTNYLYKLYNVPYIPELGINILSTNRLKDTISLFNGNKATIFDKNKKEILNGIKHDNLYKTKLKIIHPKAHDAINTIDTKNTIKNWHNRLGHIGLQPLKRILDQAKIKISLSELEEYLDYTCEICVKSKYNRNINKKSMSDTSYKIGERIHSDIGGPISPITHDGYRYYITFLEKTSRYLDISLLKTKDEAYNKFIRYKNISENQTGNKIKEFFTDNGTEYINNNFYILVRKCGILHRTTPIYTKEPNGLIERINLTLMNKTRCLLAQSGLNDSMWGEALLAATFLYNRTPHTSLGFKTPYEIFHGKMPNIGYIKTWGSITYYHPNTKYKNKLQPRKNRAILIGYSDHNQYKLYDIESKKTIWSRDTTIIEGLFITNNIIKPTANNNIRPRVKKYNIKTRASKQTEIDASPSHKIEVQIPSQEDNYIYSIKDTTLIDKLTTYNKLPGNYILSAATDKEPANFQQAMKLDERNEWYKACLDENKSLLDQNTFKIIDTPPNIKPLKGRWVFKRKTIKNSCLIQDHYITNNDKTIRFKARWVIQGFNQKLGVDFLETFSTTTRTEVWHMIIIIAVNQGWYIRQYDVKNAFVHANIDAEIYTILPIGLYQDVRYRSKCCKLNKALYGLKQSPRLWNEYFSKIILRYKFYKLPYDEGVYINEEDQAIIITHVDDILIIHRDINYIKDLAKKAMKHIKLEEIGEVTTFLGNNINIDYKNKLLTIDQKDYIKKILTKFNMYQYTPKKLPGEPGIHLKKNQYKTSDEITNLYQKEIGSLLYTSLKTRLDIAYSVSYCARYMSNPAKEHIAELKKIWKYLLYTPNLGLIYDCSGKNLYIKGYSDADWGGDIDGRKSTTGYLFSLSNDMARNNPITWNSQLQKSVALSTCEAEYMALKEAVTEGIYLANIFNYINKKLILGYIYSILLILVDNQSTIDLSENPEYHKRTKHIDIIYHYTRDQIRQKRITIQFVPTKKQLADILTKNLRLPIYDSLKELANMNNIT
jgi:hypothetical protein